MKKKPIHKVKQDAKLIKRQSLQTLWKDNTIRIKLIAFLLLCIILIGCSILIDETGLQNRDKNINYYKAKVIKVIEDSTAIDTNTEGVRRGSQVLQIEITNGEHKGEIVTVDNYLSALYNVYAKEGIHLIMRATKYEDNIDYSIFNYDRTPILYGFIGLFVLALCFIGGKKGVMALLSLLITLYAVIRILLPLLIKGFAPLPTTILLIIITTIFSYILIDSINKKTVSAAIGTIIGVGIAGILAYIVGYIGRISGFQMEEAESLLLIAGNYGLKIKDLFICGILIASLGAIMDVAMSIASSIHELHEVNPSLSAKELFRSGMNIGKDAMGTMANTLILAFTGASLNLLLMIYSYGIPYIQLINTDVIAIEIIKSIAGSIGIVLTVPVVAFLSSNIQTKFHE